MEFEFDLFEFIKDCLIFGTFIYCCQNCPANYVIAYYLFAALVMSGWFAFFIAHEEKFQDKVRDLVWNTGLKEDVHYWLGFWMCFFLGFYLLPSKIIKRLLGRDKHK